VSTWNYRIVRTETKDGPMWALHEVYYDDAGRPVAMTADPTDFASDDGPDGVVVALEMALSDAKNRPVLMESEIGVNRG
jgi:hypothetical protein